MAELTYLVPSRGRPKNAVQLYESFRETCELDTKLIILVDQDDPALSTYYTLLNGFGQVLVVNPEKRGMVEALQLGLQTYREHLGFAIGFMGDDHRPRTVGWDRRYVEQLKSFGTGFVYGNDLFQGEAIATQVAMTTNVFDVLGYICPPGFDHLCVDVVWKDWGETIDRIQYLDDVIIEHMHYLVGKSKNDAGYAAVNNSAMAGHDNTEYQRYHTSGEFDQDVVKLKQLIEEPQTEPLVSVEKPRGSRQNNRRPRKQTP